MKKILSVFVVLFALGGLAGCTTAMYTAPTPLAPHANRYNFSIEVSAFTSASTADQRAVSEITKFMNENGYKSYKILHRKHIVFPVYFYKYTVQFKK